LVGCLSTAAAAVDTAASPLIVSKPTDKNE